MTQKVQKFCRISVFLTAEYPPLRLHMHIYYPHPISVKIEHSICHESLLTSFIKLEYSLVL